MNSRFHSLKRYPAAPYCLPMAIFALFTYLPAWLDWEPAFSYGLKTVIVGGILSILWRDYRHEVRFCLDIPAIAGGVAVFFIWVLPDGWYPTIGSSAFDPYTGRSLAAGHWVAGVRIAGAVLVVPLMEELFWRSFAMRYLIDGKFQSIGLGTFTWFSFLAVSVSFGFAHDRWLVGIIAGMIYAALLIRSKNLFSPICSHAVTNLLLGVYVLSGGHWHFW